MPAKSVFIFKFVDGAFNFIKVCEMDGLLIICHQIFAVVVVVVAGVAVVSGIPIVAVVAVVAGVACIVIGVSIAVVVAASICLILNLFVLDLALKLPSLFVIKILKKF